MIAYAGMSEKLPNLCYYSNDEYSFSKPYSERTAELIDEEAVSYTHLLLAGLHPADIAELCNELDAEEARFIYLLLDNETAADVPVSYTHLPLFLFHYYSHHIGIPYIFYPQAHA